MNGFQIIAADPPWQFGDALRMSKTKRGAAANYQTMETGLIARLPIERISAADALLALWVPSSMIDDGLLVASWWGFKPKQIYTWVKTAKGPSGLAFGMGRQFRVATEHALICTRGKPKPANRSLRNVVLFPALPHSRKPDILQAALELMYPSAAKLELFARRDRPNWTCVGNECPSTMGVDIRDWLSKTNCS